MLYPAWAFRASAAGDLSDEHGHERRRFVCRGDGHNRLNAAFLSPAFGTSRESIRPRCLITGLTQDGTFLIENGAIKCGIKNMPLQRQRHRDAQQHSGDVAGRSFFWRRSADGSDATALKVTGFLHRTTQLYYQPSTRCTFDAVLRRVDRFRNAHGADPIVLTGALEHLVLCARFSSQIVRVEERHSLHRQLPRTTGIRKEILNMVNCTTKLSANRARVWMDWFGAGRRRENSGTCRRLEVIEELGIPVGTVTGASVAPSSPRSSPMDTASGIDAPHSIGDLNTPRMNLGMMPQLHCPERPRLRQMQLADWVDLSQPMREMVSRIRPQAEQAAQIVTLRFDPKEPVVFEGRRLMTWLPHSTASCARCPAFASRSGIGTALASGFSPMVRCSLQPVLLVGSAIVSTLENPPEMVEGMFRLLWTSTSHYASSTSFDRRSPSRRRFNLHIVVDCGLP